MYQGPKTNGFAIAALVLGILGLCYGFPGILGVIFGLVAINQIKNSPEQMGGKGMALAGTITGGILFGLWMIMYILYAILIIPEL